MLQYEQIENYSQSQIEELNKMYDERQILGIFTFGKINYDFARDMNDIQTLFIYLPTYAEMCSINLKEIYDNIVIKLSNGTEVTKVDIRKLYNFASKQDILMIETLFAYCGIVNSRYQKIFKKYILMNRETFFHCDPQARVNSIVARGLMALNKYEETSDLDYLFQACYLRITGRLYLDGISCENCIHLKDYYKVYLWQILEGKIQPNLEEIKKDFLEYEEEVKDFQKDEQGLKQIAKGVQEIMKVALTDMVQDEDFREKLTSLEEQALDIILSNLEEGHEGNISISQLVAASNLSRPVFKNVLRKMEDNLIAEVENQGVKGTYVKIIDGILLKKEKNK